MLLPGCAPSGPLLSIVPPDGRERFASPALSEHWEPHLENEASACCPGLSFLLLTSCALRGGWHIVAQRADLGDKQQNLKNCMILCVIFKGNRKEASPAMTSPFALFFVGKRLPAMLICLLHISVLTSAVWILIFRQMSRNQLWLWRQENPTTSPSTSAQLRGT